MRMRKSKVIFCFYCIALLFLTLPILSVFQVDFALVTGKDVNFILNALWVSMSTSLIAMGIVTIIGIPAGYAMARCSFWGKNFFDLLFQIPMVLPPAVMGLFLLMTFGRNGFVGKYLAQLGVQIIFSRRAVVIAVVFVSLPVFISGVCEGFSKVDRDLELTAQLLGDSPLHVFRRVTLPLARSSIITSLILAWARGIAEFGATMMFAGNITKVTQTIPLAIYTSMESDLNLAMVLSLLMLVIAGVVLGMVHLIAKRAKV